MNNALTYSEMLEVIHGLYNTLDAYRRFQQPGLVSKVEKVIRKSKLKANSDKFILTGESK